MVKKKCGRLCPYYDRRSMLCGFCVKKILEERKKERREEKDVNGQNDHESDE